jgi:hypothetical protein
MRRVGHIVLRDKNTRRISDGRPGDPGHGWAGLGLAPGCWDYGEAAPHRWTARGVRVPDRLAVLLQPGMFPAYRPARP